MTAILPKTLVNYRPLLGVLVAVAALLVPIPGFAQAPAAAAPLRIVIIGDSTVCNYQPTEMDRGWGMFVAGYFKEGTVKVINLAVAGRSTKSYIKEGRWPKALAEKPDFVLIQFGHNDSHAPEKPEATDAKTDYKDFLRQYVDESRAIGATPILITPMVRRLFDANGKIAEGAPERSLLAYSDAMKEVGVEKKVAVIDLHASSQALVEGLGRTASAEMAGKAHDATHFNEKGARAMAELVMKDLPKAEPRLKALMQTP